MNQSRVILVLMLSLVAAEARAGDAARWKKQSLVAGEQACLDDYLRLCTSAGTDRDAVHDCFLAHRASVSATCMSAVKSYRPDLMNGAPR